MSEKLRITFTGGDRLGDEVQVAFGGSVLVGRSHAAEIRIMDGDVSGRHLEIFRDGDGFAARNLSRFGSIVDGVKLSSDATAPLRKGSVVEVGARVRFRIDDLPAHAVQEPVSVPVPAGETAGTVPYGGATLATVFSGGATVATRAGALPPGGLAAVAVGSVDESATRDAFSVANEVNGCETSEVPSGSVTVGDESETEDSPPSAGDAVQQGTVVEPVPAPSPVSVAVQQDTMTDLRGSTDFISSDSEATVGPEAPDDDETGDGETKELVTRIGSVEEILDRKRQLDRKATAKHWKFAGGVLFVLAILGGLWLANASRKNVTDAEGPFLPNGEKDVVDEDVLNVTGDPVMFLEYPRDDRMEVIRSADSNQFDVASFIGRDRDVPFRLAFSRKRDAGELKISLVESFQRWATALKESGFRFAPRNGRPLEIEFFEKVFPGWQEAEKPSGVPFIRSEYTRAVGEVMWHGFCYRLRHGDIVYSLRTEIPEAYWKRGGYRLRNVPFMGLYRVFTDRQWDSPGQQGLLTDVSEDELLSRIRHELTAGSTRTWSMLEKMVDTLLAMTWGRESANAKSALMCLDSFQERKSQFYNERRFAYEIARLNGAEKRLREITQDCRAVFSVLRYERRRDLVNNPEVWPCQVGR